MVLAVLIALSVGLAAYWLLTWTASSRASAANALDRRLEKLKGETAAVPAQETSLLRDVSRASRPGIRPLWVMLLAAALLAGLGRWLAAAVALAAGLYLQTKARREARKRNEAFLTQFPDALDIMVRGAKAGFALPAAIRMVADHMPGPLGPEFRQVADEASYGSPLMDALVRLAARIDEPDVKFFVVMLSIQQEVGGSIAEGLGKLAAMLRKRRQLRLKVRAFTAEGRATAWVLAALPVLEAGLIHVLSPHHLDPFFASVHGNLLLAATVGVVALGVTIVRWMLRVEF